MAGRVTTRASTLLSSSPRLLPLFALAWLALCLAWVSTVPDLVRLDRDEGLNLMKARLVSLGYHLYDQIWSDQPPLYTYMLVGWGRLVGDAVMRERMLSALMSSLAVAMIGLLAWRWSGRRALAGLVAMALVVTSKQYLKLSSSVMIGLPAVAVALLGVWLASVGTDDDRDAEPTGDPSPPPARGGVGAIGAMLLGLASGAAFAASTQIKLYTFILLPVVGLVLWRNRRARIARGAAWLIGFAAVMAIVFPWSSPAWRDQLVAPHVTPQISTRLNNVLVLGSRFTEDGLLTITAVAALVVAGRRAVRRSLPAIVWVGASVVGLLNAQPIWSHHRVMLTLPLSLIVAIGLTTLLEQRRDPADPAAAPRAKAVKVIKVLVIAALGFGALRMALAVHDQIADNRMSREEQERFAAIVAERPRVRWAVTDDPQMLYVAGMKVPPEAAVISSKRTRLGMTAVDYMTNAIDAYRPEVVYLSRYRYNDAFHAHLRDDYILRDHDGQKVFLYVRAQRTPADDQAGVAATTQPVGALPPR